MLGGNTGTGVGHGQMAAVLIDPPTQRDGAARGRVLPGVLSEVPERRVHETGIRHETLARLDAHLHAMARAVVGHEVLGDQREQGCDIDRRTDDLLIARFESRELEQVGDDRRHPFGLAPHLEDRLPQIRRDAVIERQRIEIARDYCERRTQLVRGVGDEILAHDLELGLAGDIAHQQHQLPFAVGHALELDPDGIADARLEPHRRAEVALFEIAPELRQAQQARERDAMIGLPAQPEQFTGLAVEPEDLVLGVEHYHAVRHGRRGAAQFAEQRQRPLLVELLATVQPRDLRHDIAPQTAGIRRRTTVAVAQPVVELTKLEPLVREGDGERPGQTQPGMSDRPAHQEAEDRDTGKPGQGAPIPESIVQDAYSPRPEKRYPAPRTVCTRRSYPNSSRALRRRRICTSMVRSST